jgi:hypothetical protein
VRNPLAGNKVNETYQATNGHPKSSWNVTYDRTAGLPKGCEPQGDGAPIVAGGVTPTHGGWESQPQGEGEQELRLDER